MADERKVYIVGMGMGGDDQVTGQGIRCLKEAQALMGARRVLESAAALTDPALPRLESYRQSEMVRWLSGFSWRRAALAVSGDTGFYSGAAAAAKAFKGCGWQVELVPGISSLSWFAARLGRSWQELSVLSCHGRDSDPVGWVRTHAHSFLLLGGEMGAEQLCRRLAEEGPAGCHLWIGENFSYENERIEDGDVPEMLERLSERPFSELCCAVVDSPGTTVDSPGAVAEADCGPAVPGPAVPVPAVPCPVAAGLPSFGLPDTAFFRGKVPMTKSEVRAVSLSKLRLYPGAICYDIGSGSGSVAVEMGLALRSCGSGSVYAIERSAEAFKLTAANIEKFLGGWDGYHLVEGRAPQALKGIPAPTHVFIGGSGGAMAEIIRCILAANSEARIVANAITLETVSELLQCKKEFGFTTWELVQLTATPFEQTGPYHMPKSGNPVYIAVLQNPEACSKHDSRPGTTEEMG